MRYLLIILIMSLVSCKTPRPFEKKFLVSKGTKMHDSTVSVGVKPLPTSIVKKPSFYLKGKARGQRVGMNGNWPYYNY